MLKKGLIGATVLIAGLAVFVSTYSPRLSEAYGAVETELFLGDGDLQPLVVGFGGGEGGNAWASERWNDTRDRFLEEGFAFLAIGYFGADGTPAALDRISLNAIHDSIMVAAGNSRVDPQRIALIGASKGAELALNLASRYPDIGAVVGIVPSHVSFPATNLSASTSSWMFDDREVPFVPMRWSALPALLRGDLRSAFSGMLENDEAVTDAAIAVERINGPILLVSATRDEMWPSTAMSEAIVRRLDTAQFEHPVEHLVIEGGHAEPLDHFDAMFAFLNQNFREPNGGEREN